MADATTGMTYKEKSAFASDGLPDPRFSNEEETETPVLPSVKRVRKTIQKRKTQRKRKSTLKGRKVVQKRLRRA
jgi:hypothetical protein